MRICLYLLACCTLGLCSGCEVTIPASDRTPPTFLLEISSGLPGGPLQISSSDDLSNKQLNLRRNTLYGFRFTGSDAGGLAALKFRVNWPTDFLELEPADEEYAVTTDNAFFRELTWLGRRTEPRSGHIIVGQLNTIMYNQSYTLVSVVWEMTATDFGGTSGSANSTTQSLNVGIVDDTVEVGLINISD